MLVIVTPYVSLVCIQSVPPPMHIRYRMTGHASPVPICHVAKKQRRYSCAILCNIANQTIVQLSWSSWGLQLSGSNRPHLVVEKASSLKRPWVVKSLVTMS
ncbi:hypothetical protein M3J09_008914 [Ascochyta lentis]